MTWIRDKIIIFYVCYVFLMNMEVLSLTLSLIALAASIVSLILSLIFVALAILSN